MFQPNASLTDSVARSECYQYHMQRLMFLYMLTSPWPERPSVAFTSSGIRLLHSVTFTELKFEEPQLQPAASSPFAE